MSDASPSPETSTPPRPGKRLSVDERRAQLVEVGLALFSDTPYDDVSIDALAAAAGVSKGLLYHYFGGKRQLYVAGLRLAATRLMAAIETDAGASPLARVQTSLCAYLDFVEERAGAYAALLRGGVGSDPEVRAIMEDVRAVILGRFFDDLGVTGPRPLWRTAVRSWLGAVEHAALDYLELRDVPRPRLIHLLIANLYANLRVASLLEPQAGVEIDPVLARPLLGESISWETSSSSAPPATPDD